MARSIRSRAARATLLSAAICAGFAVAPTSADAGTTPYLHVIDTVTTDVVGPLQFDVSPTGVYVADSFTQLLTKVGNNTPIASGPGGDGDLSGVATDHSGAIAYGTSNADHSTTKVTILKPGHKPVVADLSGFERANNPDKVNFYGIHNPSECVRKALEQQQVPVSYHGEYDSHPYAVASLGGGSWAVADAGGNDIVKVDPSGHVSLLAVLPPQPYKVTKSFADGLHLPSCVVGVTYNFEPVPTDVEVAMNGAQPVLYTTTLPGGPEDGSAGARGSVYRIATGSNDPVRVATGLDGATNLAIDGKGRIYVAQIDTSTIDVISHGRLVPVFTAPGLVAVEYANRHIYASTAPALFDGESRGAIYELAWSSAPTA